MSSIHKSLIPMIFLQQLLNYYSTYHCFEINIIYTTVCRGMLMAVYNGTQAIALN